MFPTTTEGLRLWQLNWSLKSVESLSTSTVLTENVCTDGIRKLAQTSPDGACEIAIPLDLVL